MITHELAVLPEGAERMDAYLARRDTRFDADGWFEQCSAENVEIRDRFNRTGWYVIWWNGDDWVRVCELAPGERPRMFETYAYIVRK